MATVAIGAPIVAAIGASLNALVGAVNASAANAREHSRLHGELDSALRQLKCEMDFCFDDVKEDPGTDDTHELNLHEVLSGIDDYLVEVASPEKLAVLASMNRFGAAFTKKDIRPNMIKQLVSYSEILKSVNGKRKKDNGSTLAPPVTADYPAVDVLDQGFANNLKKATALISPNLGPKLIRLAIVGGAGLGKTVLAKSIYEKADPSHYTAKLWINATTCMSSKDLLNELKKEIRLLTSDGKAPDIVETYLVDTRYIVVIDDLSSSAIRWEELQDVFPNFNGSRVIVTTTVHSIARNWSSGRYYIYPLQPLSDASSTNLFWRKRGDREHTAREAERLRVILAKCSGLPIAISSAAAYLCKESDTFLSEERCKEICDEFSRVVLTGESSFAELRKLNMRCFQNLRSYDERMCLMSFSFYPRGSVISMNNFARKMSAEGLLDEEAAKKCLKQLIDKSMVCNVDQKYQMLDAPHQFAMCKASARNLVTVIDQNGCVSESAVVLSGKKKVSCRRLVCHSTAGIKIPEDLDLSTIRSFTVFQVNDPKWIHELNFNGFKVLRVLDLQNCKGFREENVFRSICKIKLLKFLDLRGSDLGNIPPEIEKLIYLETLDVRHTQVEALPLQVLLLPQLSSVSGNFVIQPFTAKEKIIVTRFLKTKSKLHTLSGICLSQMSGFACVVSDARLLKKIKVCGESPLFPEPRKATRFGCIPVGQTIEYPDFQSAVNSLVSAIHTRQHDLEQITIHSSIISKAFLQHPVVGTKLCTFKMHGALLSLPVNLFETVFTLTKVCLYETGLPCEPIVRGLHKLRSLEHLELGKEQVSSAWVDSFVVEKDHFPALRSLVFVGPKKHPALKIGNGALKALVSLQLLCPMLDEVEEPCRVEGVFHLTLLGEVILHHSAADLVVRLWEQMVEPHENMPCVRRQARPARPGENGF